MNRGKLCITVAAVGVLLGGCEVGTKVYEQTGYRGTGADQIVDKSQAKAALKKVAAVPPPPYELTAEMMGGERASAAYQNVQVLGDISTEQFNYLMASMVTWIAPGEGDTQGCNYCHNAENYALDKYPDGRPIYTKIVARRMIQMTRNINGSWGKHVTPAGVTCWTCHRGNAVPVNKWAIDPKGDAVHAALKGNKRGQNTPLQVVDYASLPSDPFSAYLRGNQEIRLADNTSHPSPSNPATIKSAEHTYSLMIHMSKGLGVNCTYCHNAGNFASWSLSRPQRSTAWYGIRMVRNINNAYIEPLAPVFPAVRKGALGDPYKVNCATCHQGQSKPMNGYPMLKDYPMLHGAAGPMTVAAASPNWQVPAGPDARSLVAARAGLMPVAYTPPVAAPAIPTGAGALASTVDGQPRLNVYFARGEAALAPEFAERGAGVVGYLKSRPDAKLVVSGYNDPTGNAALNAKLSKERAKAVAAALGAAGVDESRIVLEKPAETTLTGDDAAARRVEVMVRD